MTFNIRKTDNTLVATLAPGTYNSTATSLILFGKNFANYGTALNEDLVHLMEHFAYQTPPNNPIVGQLWFDTVRNEMKVWQNEAGVLQWVLLNSSSLRSIAEAIVPNKFYVSSQGDDNNSGKSWYTSKKSIKSACLAATQAINQGEFAAGSVVILVNAGDYTEECPITVPAGVSIVGDNISSVTVRPSTATSTKNVFLLDSATYVYGIAVKGHQLTPSALDITPYNAGNTSQWADASGASYSRNISQTGFAFAFLPGADIQVAPYIQNCASISGDLVTNSGASPGGGGVLVDPTSISDNSRLHTIQVDTFSAINCGGMGCKVVGKGLAELNNFSANFCQFGVLAVDGGEAQLTNSEVSFGNYGLWAEGYRWMDNSQAVNQTWTTTGNTTQFTTNAGTKVYPEQYNSLVLEVNGIQQIYGRDFSLSDGGSNNTIITLLTPPTGNLTVQARIRFVSFIDAGALNYNYAGAGISYSNISLSQGGTGRSDANKYTIQFRQEATNLAGTVTAVDTLSQTVYTSGKIYQTSTDERGNLFVGPITPGSWTNNVQASATPSFRINQEQGTIEGKTFYNSIFGFMAPFVLALTRRGN